MSEASKDGNGKQFAATVAVCMTLIGFIYTLNRVDNSNTREHAEAIKNAVEAIQAWRSTLDEERGRRNQQIDDLTRETKALDERLQREMRDLDAIADTKLSALDRRLQEEITRSASIGATDRAQIHERIDKVTETVLQNRADIVRLDTLTKEKL